MGTGIWWLSLQVRAKIVQLSGTAQGEILNAEF
jgi:hypothetical protein